MTEPTSSPMQSLFGERGLRRLDEIVRPGVLCAFDFDGTLAPIVAKPDQAHLPDEIRAHLRELSGHAPTAIITGRSVADIKTRLGFEPTYVVGNHGLEGVPGWVQRSDDYLATCREWMRQIAAVQCEPGVQLEDKNYSLSLHYRLAQEPAAAAHFLRALVATLQPAPHVIEGKYVFNLLPKNAADKGRALERLIDVCAAPGAVYVGDDVTDEDVFRLRRPDILSIRIECEPASAAEFFVPQRGDIARVLDLLMARLGGYRWRASSRSEAAGNG